VVLTSFNATSQNEATGSSSDVIRLPHYIGIAVVIGISYILLLVLLMIVRTRRRKEPEAQEKEVTQNVVYAEEGEEGEAAAGATHLASHDDEAKISYRQHLLDISEFAGFIIISEIFQNSLPLIDMAFLAQLGKQDLGAAALATVWFNLWNFFMSGFMTGVGTLLAQSYGANDKIAFRAWTGTGLLAALIVTVPVARVISLCGPAMKLLGQDPKLADEAGQFSYRLIPGLFPYYAFKVFSKYLQTQDIFLPGTILGLVASGLNVFFNWLLIYFLDMGIGGAPWATTATRCVEFLMLLGYMLWNRQTLLQSTWPVFSMANLAPPNLQSFWALSISGALSVTVMAWAFVTTSIFAGLLGTTELGAHVLTMSMDTFLFLSVPYSVGTAASIRVGQHIGGAGRAADAQRSGIASLLLAVSIETVLVCVILSCKDSLAQYISGDQDVADLVVILIPIWCLFMMGDAFQATIEGILIGLGHQKDQIFLNIPGFWVLAVPIGFILTFMVDLGVSGLWWGMAIGLCSTSITGVMFLKFGIDWRLEEKKALEMVSTMFADANDKGGASSGRSNFEGSTELLARDL
jgi:MATE family multidrug resistance protein